VIIPSTIRQLKSKLRYSFQPFFGRFGKLTPVQLQAIPLVLEGRNAVVTSATASGKTESVVAPLAEICVSDRLQGIAVVYIVPTRALANDTFDRIHGPLQDMGLNASIKHGDKPHVSLTTAPHFLITTPESFDSFLCRRPGHLLSVRAIIVDEVHMIDRTQRGDQMRVLLRRLQHLIGDRQINLYLLSATLAEPKAVASRYISHFEIVSVPGKRNLNYQALAGYDDLYETAKNHKLRKLLVFCNYRASVEKVAGELSSRWHPYPVVVHHGSLSRHVRQEAESVMQETQVAVCVATSTLEVGIDIGDIDAIVLAETPWSISSLLQRIGRGNRRSNEIRVLSVIKSEAEKQVLATMIGLAKVGAISSQTYKAHQTVTVQQTLSIVFQHKNGIAISELAELLSPIANSYQTQAVVAYLKLNGLLEQLGQHILPATKLMDWADRGEIHSNIPDSNSCKVVDSETGKEIGQVSGSVNELFALGQRSWKIESLTGGTLKVKRHKGKATAADFVKHFGKGAFTNLVPPELKDM